MSRKPKVGTAYPADRYAAPEERIMEVSHELGGCLISVRPVNDRLLIEIYRADDTIDVRGPGGRQEAQRATLAWTGDNPDEPLDQNADSLAVPHGFWAIGIDTMTNMWTVDLYEIPNIETPGVVIDALALPDQPTEALAKDAAQRTEEWLLKKIMRAH
jgi:hypothetical protein